MVGGREIVSAFFNSGGTLGLEVDPLDVRSVLILGGRRGLDVPGRSHSVCLLSAGWVTEVVCDSSRRGVGGWKDDSTGCDEDEGGNSGGVKVCAGTGCIIFGGEFDGIGRVGSGNFRGKNAGALGFNGTSGGEGTISDGGGWG